jgi:pimeloyl-ACP methyl ester carboxylesterase
MGGAVSIVVAANRPDLVRTLTLVSPAVPDLRPRRADPTLPLVAMPLVGPLIMRQVVRMRPDARVRVALALCFADPSRVPPQRLAEAEADVVYRAGLEHAPEAFVRALRGLIAAYLQPGSRSMWAQAAAVEAPTLIVWGRQDKLVDVALSSRLAAAVPQSRLLVLDDVGHVAQMEDPVSTARAVVALLEDAASLSVTR